MDEKPFPILYIDEKASEEQISRLQSLRFSRDSDRVRAALGRLQEVARGTGNVMEPILEAARVYATLGEMCDALREVWGEYVEAPTF